MVIIKKHDWIFRDLYGDILSSAPEYRFKQDGVFLSKEDAENIWKALTKRPIECDSEEEVWAIQAAVQMLKKSLAVISYDTVKEDHAKDVKD